MNKLFYKGKEVKISKPDGSVTVIEIPTPKGWKCKVKKCSIDWMHNHNLFTSLWAKKTIKNK